MLVRRSDQAPQVDRDLVGLGLVLILYLDLEHGPPTTDTHLTSALAALAVTTFFEDHTGWSIKRFVRPQS